MIVLVFAPLSMLLDAADDKPVKEPSELTAARQAYQTEQAKVTAAYVAKLEALKMKLGTSGRIDDAILVKAEADKISEPKVRQAVAAALDDLAQGRLALGAGAGRGNGYFRAEQGVQWTPAGDAWRAEVTND